MQLVQHNPSLQKPCDPTLIGKQVIYIVLWDEIFTKAAKPKALAQTPTVEIWGFERRGLHQTGHFISLYLDCVLASSAVEHEERPACVGSSSVFLANLLESVALTFSPHCAADFKVSLDSRVREAINRNMQEPTLHTFDDAQLQIYTLMQRDSYPRYMNSPAYKNLLNALSEQSPES